MRVARVLAAITVAVVCLGGLASEADAATPSSPWPQTDGNAALSRANNAEHALTASTVLRVRLQRTIRSTQDEDCFTTSSPVLSGGFIYAVQNNMLRKIDARTGSVRWSVTAGVDDSTYFVGLAVVGDTVVLDQASCHSESDPNRTIRAFDVAHGSVKWQARAMGFGNMVVSQGFVVTIGVTVLGTDLEVFRLDSGAAVWSKSAACGVDARVAVVQGLVTYGWCNETDNWVSADRLSSGDEVWRSSDATRVLAGDSDTSSGKHVYLYGQGGVRDVDPATGRSRFVLAGATDVLAVAPRHVFADCSSGAVCGYDLATGARQWRRSGSATSGATANGVLYLSDGRALRTSTGVQLARLFTSSTGTPAVGDGRVVIPVSFTDLAVYGLPGY